MTNSIAITLGLALVGLIVVDSVIFGAEHLVFLSKKIFDMIEWLAFWR